MENIFNWKPIYASSYKQETLEEFKKRFANDESNKNIGLNYQDGIYYGIEVGAKWEKERMYSEEDMQSLIKIRNYFGENDKTSFEHFAYSFLDGIIKQFKNK